MRIFAKPKPRFLAAVITLSAVVPSSMFLLTGCGSGGGTAPSLLGFNTGSGSPTNPTPNGATPTPNPTPNPTPTINPTPTPNPTPTTSPTPNPTPSTGSGTLFDFYNGFAFNANDTFTYQFTETDTQNPDPNGVSGTTTNRNTFKGGILFGTGLGGQKTTVTINLPLSGSKTVTREEQLNPSNNAVIGYTYYTQDATGRTEYGSDSVFNGVVTSSTRNDNGERIPFSLSPGQSNSQTFTVFETEYDSSGAVTQQYNFVQRETITFVGTGNVSVIGGTYSNVAQLRLNLSYTLPAIATGRPTDESTTEARDIYLSKFVGLVLATNRSVTQNVTGTDATGNSYIFTDTVDGRQELVSATVGGTNYPPGRSVTSFGGTIPKHSPLFSRRH